MKYIKKFEFFFNKDKNDENLSNTLIELIKQNGVKYREYGLFYILFEIPNNGTIYMVENEETNSILLHHGDAKSFVATIKTLKGLPYRYQKIGSSKNYFSIFTEELSDLIFEIIKEQ